MKDVMAWTVRFMTDCTISLRFHDGGTIIYSLSIMYFQYLQGRALKKFIDTYSVTCGIHFLHVNCIFSKNWHNWVLHRNWSNQSWLQASAGRRRPRRPGFSYSLSPSWVFSFYPRSLFTNHEGYGQKLGPPRRLWERDWGLQKSGTMRTSTSWRALVDSVEDSRRSYTIYYLFRIGPTTVMS